MKKQLITLAALAGGFIIGASALVALAQNTGGWTPAPNTPPTPNVPAPINVGGGTAILQSTGKIPTSIQEKTDSMAIDGNLGVLGTLAATYLNVASGTITTAGSVLTNDGSGNASWQAGGGGGNSQIISGGTQGDYFVQIGPDTLLEGGILYPGAVDASVSFAVPFAQVISIQVLPINENNGTTAKISSEEDTKISNLSNTGFTANAVTSAQGGFSWMAIGTVTSAPPAYNPGPLNASGVTCTYHPNITIIPTGTNNTIVHYTLEGPVTGGPSYEYQYVANDLPTSNSPNSSGVYRQGISFESLENSQSTKLPSATTITITSGSGSAANSSNAIPCTYGG